MRGANDDGVGAVAACDGLDGFCERGCPVNGDEVLGAGVEDKVFL